MIRNPGLAAHSCVTARALASSPWRIYRSAGDRGAAPFVRSTGSRTEAQSEGERCNCSLLLRSAVERAHRTTARIDCGPGARNQGGTARADARHAALESQRSEQEFPAPRAAAPRIVGGVLRDAHHVATASPW